MLFVTFVLALTIYVDPVNQHLKLLILLGIRAGDDMKALDHSRLALAFGHHIACFSQVLFFQFIDRKMYFLLRVIISCVSQEASKD